jgi:uncharacterized OB-fold protein
VSRAPQVNRDNQFFWDGIEAGEFRIQRCLGCGQLRFPPRPMCPNCQSLDWDTQVASGDATVYSYVIVHRPHPDEFPDRYLVALLNLEEGIRFVSDPVDQTMTGIEIGARVRLEITEVEPGVHLPLFCLV